MCCFRRRTRVRPRRYILYSVFCNCILYSALCGVDVFYNTQSWFCTSPTASRRSSVCGIVQGGVGRPRAGRQRTASAPIPVMSETQSGHSVRPNSTQRNSNSPAQTHGLGDPPASRLQGSGANVLYASPDVRARGQAGHAARVSCLRGGEGREKPQPPG